MGGAGRPDGSALGYWLQAELELGIIKSVAPDDPFVSLQELAEKAQERDAADTPEAAEVVQRSVDAAVPRVRPLPASAAENPVSHRREGAGGSLKGAT